MRRFSLTPLLKFLPIALFVAASLFMTATAHCYLPNSRTIAGRVAKNDGKGIYAIEQDVYFRTTTDGMTLHERWIVESGENMRLTVTSPAASAQNIRYDVVYRDGKRTLPDLRGAAKTTALTNEFTEWMFHSRTQKSFFDALIHAGIVPNWFPKERPRAIVNANTLPNAKFLPGAEPLVRLGRTAGVVAYVFGEPTPSDAEKSLAGAWIEQDAFVVRKLRFPTEAEVTASRHSIQAGGLRFPRDRVISWNGHAAEVRLVSAKLVTAQSTAALLNPAAIANEAKSARLPADDQVREFYSRFR